MNVPQIENEWLERARQEGRGWGWGHWEGEVARRWWGEKQRVSELHQHAINEWHGHLFTASSSSQNTNVQI